MTGIVFISADEEKGWMAEGEVAEEKSLLNEITMTGIVFIPADQEKGLEEKKEKVY